ncbi:MAG: tetratricopeptide repeat protein [Planctomycetaceae bacterium]|nr:tetratricopeptide repeat protein [Planctomycetaceae bacterium]
MYRTLNSLGWLLSALLLCATTVFADEAANQFSLAAVHYSHQRWDLAVEEFGTFLERFQSHERAPNASFYLGESLLQLKRYTEARAQYQRVVNRSPESTFAHQATFRAAEMLFLNGEREKAADELTAFDKDKGSDKLNAYSLAYRGQIAVDAGKAEFAEALYRDAIERFPDGPLKSEIRFGLARALELKGDNDEALRFYQFLAEHSQSSLRDDAHLRAGILLYQKQEYSEAIAILAKFDGELAESPLRNEARYWSGMCLLKSGDAAGAVDTFTQGEPVATDHPLAAALEFGRAEALRESNDLATAITSYGNVHTSWPNSEWADDALYTICTLAFAADDSEQFKRNAMLLQEQYATSPLIKNVIQLTGRMALRQHRYDDAIAAFKSLEDGTDGVTASSQATQYYLGMSYLAAKRAEDAFAALQQITPASDASELRDNVAVATASALMALDRYEEALIPLADYLKSQPNGADAAACRAKLTLCYLELNDTEQLQTAFQQYREHDAATPTYLQTIAYLAEQSVAKGNIRFGRELYTLLSVDTNPEDFIAKGLTGLGQLQLAEGDTDGSAKTFGRLLDKAAMSNEAPRAGLMQARSLEQASQFDAALAAYRLVIKDYAASPESSIAMFEASRLHDRLGQDLEAHDLLQQLLTRTPTIEQLDAVLYQLAWVLTDLGKVTESDAIFVQLVGEYPTSRYWADATYRVAERSFHRGDTSATSSYLEQLLATELEPRLLTHSLYLQGQLAAQQDKWAEVAIPMQRLVNAFPESELSLAARYWVAEAAFRQTDYTGASELFTTLGEDVGDLKTAWTPMVPLRQAQCLAHQEQWAEALAIAQSIGDRFPDFRQLYEADYVIGRCLSMQARFSAARDAFTQVVRSTTGGRTETAAMAQWMIGESYFHQKDYREAIRAYHRVVSLYAFPQWQAAALLQAGKCHEQTNEWREAVKLYTQLLRDYPETPHAADASQRLRVAQRTAGTNTN